MPDPNDRDQDELHEKLRRAFGESADDGLEKYREDKESGDITELPDTSELDQRLKAVVSKTANYKEKSTQTAEQLAKTRRDERADARGLGMGLQIAYTIIGFPLLGFGSGAVVDILAKANIWKGILGLLGCVLAIFTAILLINRAASDI